MKRGFTIVELIIAMAVVVLLLGVAVPRFDKFGKQQQFSNAASELVQCIQSAQRKVVSPAEGTGPVRYTSVTIADEKNSSGDPIGLSCTIRSYPATMLDGSAMGVAQLQGNQEAINGAAFQDFSVQIIHAADLALANVVFPGQNLQIGIPHQVRVYFGSIERGVPVVACAENAANKPAPPLPPLCNTGPLDISPGNGFETRISIANRMGPPDYKKGLITIGTLGSPIAYETVE